MLMSLVEQVVDERVHVSSRIQYAMKLALSSQRLNIIGEALGSCGLQSLDACALVVSQHANFGLDIVTNMLRPGTYSMPPNS